jgi:tetratricopeptide (TPR) repeat protein
LLLVVAVLVCGAAVIRRQLNAAPVSTVTAVEDGSATAVSQWQAQVAQNPDNANAHTGLGLAYLQRVRETGDSALYILAEQALNQALSLEPQQVDALMGQGILALARHDFEAALVWGEKARELNPYRAQIVGIFVDAYVELGRYEEAVTAAQTMVDLRPDLASYSRVSYLRELHGDVAGAIMAMETAVASGIPGAEETAWAQVQLGNLYLNSGDVDRAEAIYRETLYYRPDYAHAVEGLAEVQAARGEYESAIEIMRPLVERLPLPEFAILLGEWYEATGQPEMAEQQYDLVRFIQQLNVEAGMNVDIEMALFEANHGNPARAVEMAKAGYGRHPNIYAADALAWALYQNGEYEEASRYSQEALRLGTQDASLYYHAGLIARALGNEEQAEDYLETAVAINPNFSIRQLNID